MATTKPQVTDTNAPINLDAILDSLLPPELKAKDLSRTGELTPIFNFKLAHEKKLVVAGRLHIIETLPIEGAEKPRLVLKVRDLTAPTIGTQGPKSDQRQVEIPKGGEILVPVSGNLANNKDLIDAIMDVDHVYFGVFAVTGTMPRKGKNDMWVVDCRIALQERMKRTDKYLLPVSYARALARGDVATALKGEFPAETTADGSVYDSQTGEVVSPPRAMNASA